MLLTRSEDCLLPHLLAPFLGALNRVHSGAQSAATSQVSLGLW